MKSLRGRFAVHRGRDVFGDYYLQKHNGRKLTWHSSMESCTLKAHFDQGIKDLQVWGACATISGAVCPVLGNLFNTTE